MLGLDRTEYTIKYRNFFVFGSFFDKIEFVVVFFEDELFKIQGFDFSITNPELTLTIEIFSEFLLGITCTEELTLKIKFVLNTLVTLKPL